MEVKKFTQRLAKKYRKHFHLEAKDSRCLKKLDLKFSVTRGFYFVPKKGLEFGKWKQCPNCGSKDLLKTTNRVYCYQCKKSFPPTI